MLVLGAPAQRQRAAQRNPKIGRRRHASSGIGAAQLRPNVEYPNVDEQRGALTDGPADAESRAVVVGDVTQARTLTALVGVVQGQLIRLDWLLHAHLRVVAHVASKRA